VRTGLRGESPLRGLLGNHSTVGEARRKQSHFTSLVLGLCLFFFHGWETVRLSVCLYMATAMAFPESLMLAGHTAFSCSPIRSSFHPNVQFILLCRHNPSHMGDTRTLKKKTKRRRQAMIPVRNKPGTVGSWGRRGSMLFLAQGPSWFHHSGEFVKLASTQSPLQTTAVG
jgi:hypothetical protein